MISAAIKRRKCNWNNDLCDVAGSELADVNGKELSAWERRAGVSGTKHRVCLAR